MPPDPTQTKQTASYSAVIYDMTDQTRTDIINMVDNQSNQYGVQLVEDTTGGTRDDGTTFNKKTVVAVTREFGLGSGNAGVDGLSDLLFQLPIEDSKTENDFMRDILDRFEGQDNGGN